MKDKLALTGIISFVLGIMLASLYGSATILIWPCLLIGGIFLGAWWYAKRPAYAFLTFLFLGIFCGLVRFSLFDIGIRAHLEEQLGTKKELRGQVVADPDVREGTERLTLYIPSEQTHILAVVSRYPGYSYGDMVTVSGKIEHPEPFDTDGGRTFAYDKFLAKDHVSYLMNFAHIQKTGEDHSLITRVLGSLYLIKGLFATGLQEALPEPASSLAEGILVGGKQGLGTDLLDTFTVTGLLPIIVLSGYNVMIVAEAVLLCFGFVRRRLALILSGIVIVLFIILAGSGSSAVRAGIMAVLALFARATGRRYDALRILIFAFFAMLLWNPYQLMYDPGFQFSFMATLGLILLSSHLETRLTKIPTDTLREICSSTISAQLFVLPILLYQTGNLSLVSVPANIFALIAVPPAMLFSFIAGIAGMAIPSCALWIGLPAYLLLSYIILVATTFASLPFAHVMIALFPPVFLVTAYIALAWMYVRVRRVDATTP